MIPEKALEAVVPSILDRLAMLEIHDLEEAENMAHEVLEAAAPFIRAEALREYARSLDGDTLADAWMIHCAADELDPS